VLVELAVLDRPKIDHVELDLLALWFDIEEARPGQRTCRGPAGDDAVGGGEDIVQLEARIGLQRVCLSCCRLGDGQAGFEGG
jgi:hypothetical protein